MAYHGRPASAPPRFARSEKFLPRARQPNSRDARRGRRGHGADVFAADEAQREHEGRALRSHVGGHGVRDGLARRALARVLLLGDRADAPVAH